jgi:hypothetical protein
LRGGFRRDELVVDVLFDEGILEDGIAFVVEALQLRTKNRSYQCVVYDFEGLEDLGSTVGWHGLRVDAVAIVIIQDEDMRVAATGLEGKEAGLIRVYVTLYLGWHDCCKTMVRGRCLRRFVLGAIICSLVVVER